MEFPTLGTHCFVNDCRQLDFLPMKCDTCSHIFCRDHITYDSHRCEGKHTRDKVVPNCPLCGKVIPLLHGQDPNVVVGRHIDTDCQSDPAKERRNIVYVNSCSKSGCKKREAVPFTCAKCRRNFCIKHRLEVDHECGSKPVSAKPASTQPPSKNLNVNEINPSGMTEDEALAKALQESLASAPNASRQAALLRQQASSRNRSGNTSNSNNNGNNDNRRQDCSMS